MPKKVAVLGCGPARDFRLDAAELTFLDVDQVDALPECDAVVLLGDPAASGGHEDLLRRNIGWVRAAAVATARRAPHAALVVAVRPINALALAALRAGSLPRSRVLGAAGLTASLRLAGGIGRALGLAASEVRTTVLGGCGEFLVALPRLWSVGGIPATELLSREELGRLAREAGEPFSPEELLAAAMRLTAALFCGCRRLQSCSAYLDGEYGLHGIFLAVPAVLGPGGLERIVQLNLQVGERMALHKAAASARALRANLEEAL